MQQAEGQITFVLQLATLSEDLVVVGTRTEGRDPLESSVPVERIRGDRLRRSGVQETGRALQMEAPSFNFSSSSISDGTDALRPATLRGLGPDQTLVLVNGKRRHNSALLHVNTSVGRGTAGTDMNAIPLAAIERIEVLRDGAAAQYGSDAIAGVINIVLRNRPGFSMDTSWGQTYAGDGDIFTHSMHGGFASENGAFLNLTFETRLRDSTNRAGLSGARQYHYTDCASGQTPDNPAGSRHQLGTAPRHRRARFAAERPTDWGHSPAPARACCVSTAQSHRPQLDGAVETEALLRAVEDSAIGW